MCGPSCHRLDVDSYRCSFCRWVSDRAQTDPEDEPDVCADPQRDDRAAEDYAAERAEMIERRYR